jgi:hypothetical protein
LTQSLQEQFSRIQTQQSRILELLAPLHPLLESVPLHINVARNAILEKIPEGCQCPCTNDCSTGSIPSTATSSSRHTLSSQENIELPLEVRKRRRTNHGEQHCGRNDPPVNRYRDHPIAIEERQILHGPAQPGETLTSSRMQRIGTHCAVQTPNGGMNGIGPMIRNPLRNVSPVSGNAALASRLSTIPRGITPSFILVSHSEHGSHVTSDKERIHISSNVSSLLPYGVT